MYNKHNIINGGVFMKMRKKAAILLATALFAVSLCSCGEKPKESGITGAEAQEEFWSTDIDASAERLNEFRAQSPQEVVNDWRQAKVQGNGALMYALYSPDLKELFLDDVKTVYGSWNLYYGQSAPLEVTCTEPEKVDGNDMYVSDVTILESDGSVTNSQIFIRLVDGAYCIVSESTEPSTEFVEGSSYEDFTE
jgi:hypothetical protein